MDGKNILDWFFDGEDEAGIGDLNKVGLKVDKVLCLVRAVLVVALVHLQMGIVVLLPIMVEVEDRSDYMIMISGKWLMTCLLDHLGVSLVVSW